MSRGGLPSAGAEGHCTAVRLGTICPRCMSRPFEAYVPCCHQCGDRLPVEDARDEGGAPQVRPSVPQPGRRAAGTWHRDGFAHRRSDMIARPFDHPASRPGSSAVEESGARFQSAAGGATDLFVQWWETELPVERRRDFDRGRFQGSLTARIHSAPHGGIDPAQPPEWLSESAASGSGWAGPQAGRDFPRTVRGSVGRKFADRKSWASGPAYKRRRTDDENTVHLVDSP